MFADVLAYTWERNQLLDAVAELLPDEHHGLVEDDPLKRADDLSLRIVELVSQDDFDKMRANLMLAREVAYWREWLDTQVANADKNDESERAKSHKTALLISSFAEYRF